MATVRVQHEVPDGDEPRTHEINSEGTCWCKPVRERLVDGKWVEVKD